MPNDEFWAIIEAAWTGVDGNDAGQELLDDDEREEVAFALGEPMEQMMARLRETQETMDQAQFLAFDRVMERLMHRIDRAEIQAFTDGSDDGLEYARGFIVGSGRAFYELVDADPSKVACDAELDRFACVAVSVFDKRFGEDTWTPSEFCRASCSNSDAWPDL